MTSMTLTSGRSPTVQGYPVKTRRGLCSDFQILSLIDRINKNPPG